MTGSIRVMLSVAAVAGLVYEALRAKEVDPYYLSWQSLALIVMFSCVLFVVNLKKFKVIKLNSDRFDFDEWNIAGSRSFSPAKDRSELLLKVLKINNLDVQPPRSN
jgi:hypothetical protein